MKLGNSVISAFSTPTSYFVVNELQKGFIMRSARVFYLLLSVLQFILFLKLIEFVRGDELPTSSQPQIVSQESEILKNSTQDDNGGRGLFLAPKIKRKKLRPWTENTTLENGKGNADAKNRMGETDVSTNIKRNVTNQQGAKDTDNLESGRLCPGCENNQCAVADPISAGFPIIPFVIAVIVGIKWFIIFLIVWIFFVRPDKQEQQTGGYGYGPPQSGYGTPSHSHDSGHSHSFLGKIFDKLPFMHHNYRSLDSYTSILNSVLDSVAKLSDLYNSY